MEINTDFLTGAIVGLLILTVMWVCFVGVMVYRSRQKFKRFNEETDRKHDEFKKDARKRFESFQRGGRE